MEKSRSNISTCTLAFVYTYTPTWSIAFCLVLLGLFVNKIIPSLPFMDMIDGNKVTQAKGCLPKVRNKSTTD